MSSISSDTSIPEDEDLLPEAEEIPEHDNEDGPRRPFPWRWLLILALLLGAAYNLYTAAPPALRAYRAAQHPDDLALAGAVADGVESILGEGPDDPARLLAALFPPLFAAEETLAYVRVWRDGGALLGEVTQADPETFRATGTLPALDFPAALARARTRTASPEAEEAVTLMRQLIEEQAAVTGRMDDALRRGKAEGAHYTLFLQQETNLGLAESLQDKYPALRAAVQQMLAARELLTHTDEASLIRAKTCSLDAETALSLALEALRAGTDLLRRLPAPLPAAAPAGAWYDDLLPWVQGRRVTIPLFSHTGPDGVLVSAGAVEVVFYDRLADTVIAVGRHCLPALGLLLAAALLLIPRPRRKRYRPRHAAEG